jgi:magnesium-transporting ATPase (P-type)
VLAAAVLAFVQSGIVAVATVYVFLFVSIARVAVTEGAPSTPVTGLVSEGTLLAWLQLVSVVLLVAGGVLALGNRRRRPAWLVLGAAFIAQAVLALYWGIRLATLTTGDVAGPDPAAVFAWLAVVFAAMPVVGLGLIVLGPGRQWFREEPQAVAR